jgi:hypothetical protein
MRFGKSFNQEQAYLRDKAHGPTFAAHGVGGQGKTELCRQNLRDNRVQGCLAAFNQGEVTYWIDDELWRVWEVAIWRRLLVSLRPAMNTDQRNGIPVPPIWCFNAVLEANLRRLCPAKAFAGQPFSARLERRCLKRSRSSRWMQGTSCNRCPPDLLPHTVLQNTTARMMFVSTGDTVRNATLELRDAGIDVNVPYIASVRPRDGSQSGAPDGLWVMEASADGVIGGTLRSAMAKGHLPNYVPTPRLDATLPGEGVRWPVFLRASGSTL